MINKTFYTKDGAETRELTQQEIEDLAVIGDDECKKEIFMQEVKAAVTIEEKVAAIIKFLTI